MMYDSQWIEAIRRPQVPPTDAAKRLLQAQKIPIAAQQPLEVVATFAKNLLAMLIQRLKQMMSKLSLISTLFISPKNLDGFQHE